MNRILLYILLISLACTTPAYAVDKVYLHLSFNGVDEAQETTDTGDTVHSVSFINQAQLDTADKKWGTASLKLDGDGDYLTIPDHDDFEIVDDTTDTYTIEMWVKHSNSAASALFVGQFQAAADAWYFHENTDNGPRMYARMNGNHDSVDSGGTFSDDGNWNHIAWVRIGKEWGVYVNGTQRGYATYNETDTYAQTFSIGAFPTGELYEVTGWIDELVMTNYNHLSATIESDSSGSLTVPTGEFGAAVESSNVQLIVTTTG